MALSKTSALDLSRALIGYHDERTYHRLEVHNEDLAALIRRDDDQIPARARALARETLIERAARGSTDAVEVLNRLDAKVAR